MIHIAGERSVTGSSVVQLHVVDPHEATREILVQDLRARGVAFDDGTVSSRWLAMHDWDYLPSVVVVRGEMRDVWPALLKVRGLRSLGCRTVVLVDRNRHPVATERLLAAGAYAVSDTAGPLAQVIDDVAGALDGFRVLPPRSGVPGEADPVLSNRTLQVAGLYVSAQEPTSAEIAHALSIRPNTVRVHLERARSTYRQLGQDVSTRAGLRRALLDDGQLVGELGWFA